MSGSVWFVVCQKLLYVKSTTENHNKTESLHIDKLTHWGRVTNICVSNLCIIASDNGLSPGRRQAIIWSNAGILLIGPLGTNFSEIVIEIHIFSFNKIHFKMSSRKRRPFCFGLNVLTKIVKEAQGKQFNNYNEDGTLFQSQYLLTALSHWMLRR